MAEHLKKIVLPMEDGSAREIDIPERDEILATAKRESATSLLRDWADTYVEKVSTGGFNSGGHGATIRVQHIGPLKGRFTLKGDFDESCGAVFFIGPQVETDQYGAIPDYGQYQPPERILTISRSCPEATADIDLDDACLWRSFGGYSWSTYYDIRLYPAGAEDSPIDDKFHRVFLRLHNLSRDLDSKTDAVRTECRDMLPWIGSIYDFRDLWALERGKLYLITDENGIVSLYSGYSRKFPLPNIYTTMRGRFDPSTPSSDWGYWGGEKNYTRMKVNIPANESTGKFDTYNVPQDKPPRSFNGLFKNVSSLVELYLLPDYYFCNSTFEMFSGCTSLVKVTMQRGRFMNVKSMGNMFYGCAALESIDWEYGPEWKKVTNLGYMFYGCSSLKKVVFDPAYRTGTLDSVRYMFCGCSSLESLNLSMLDTSAVTSMSGMFKDCSKLRTLNLSGLDVSKVTIITSMFSGCAELETLNLSGWDLSKCNVLDLHGCSALRNVTGPISGLAFGPTLSDSPLTNESAMVFINGLVELDGVSRSINFHPDTYDTLTEEQIALATAKGWTVTRS